MCRCTSPKPRPASTSSAPNAVGGCASSTVGRAASGPDEGWLHFFTGSDVCCSAAGIHIFQFDHTQPDCVAVNVYCVEDENFEDMKVPCVILAGFCGAG
jgi:hypothetical protein